jgi:hypothetical protein
MSPVTPTQQQIHCISHILLCCIGTAGDTAPVMSWTTLPEASDVFISHASSIPNKATCIAVFWLIWGTTAVATDCRGEPNHLIG